MGRIIRLNADRHRELQGLLPWYATGQLDAAERARVDAHLAGCPECQAELRFEQKLDDEVARLPIGVEQSWARMRQRLERPRLTSVRGLAGAITAPAPWLGWAAAGFLFLITGVLLTPALQPAAYHALGAAPAAAPGNVVVIFRPETREKDLRAALNASGARVVDGPTAADAYVLHVAPAHRAAALASLRGRADVVLAQPIEPGSAR